MSPAKFLRTFSIIHMAMTIGMIGFAVVAFVMTQEDQFFYIPDMRDTFTLPVPLAIGVGITAGNYMFQKFMNAQSADKTLQQKISILLSASIIRFALIEGPVLFATVVFLMSSNLFFMVFAGIGVLYFLTLKPKNEKIGDQLELTHDERTELGIK